jgi:hypothetical protein
VSAEESCEDSGSSLRIEFLEGRHGENAVLEWPERPKRGPEDSTEIGRISTISWGDFPGKHQGWYFSLDKPQNGV